MPSLLATMLSVFLGWNLGSFPAQAAPMCQGVRFDVLTAPLSSTPYIVLDAGGLTGPWLVDFGSTISSVFADAWKASRPGEPVLLSDVGFPGAGAGPRSFPAVQGGGHRSGVGWPLGTLGTDILKNVTTELHLEHATDPHVLFLDPSCDRDASGREGFTRIGQANFFSSKPETHISAFPNVPVVFIELEERSTDRQRPRLAEPKRSARTWAQIDTGYADTYWPYTVDINEPYLAKLKDEVPSLTLAGLVSVSGCGGEDSLREVYVAPGWRLNVVPDIPQRTIPFDSFHLVVKPTRTECGGIGTLPAPAAQLGASFLRAFGTILFKPAQAEVWIKPAARN